MNTTLRVTPIILKQKIENNMAEEQKGFRKTEVL